MRRRKLNNQSKAKGVSDANVFYFVPATYSITEGVVSDAVALTNTTNINTALADAVTAGKAIFDVPTMDAYFNTQGNSTAGGAAGRQENIDSAIVIPDNMHFRMSASTVLRRQPNNKYQSVLLGAMYINGDVNRTGANIEISGGTLIGDINDHIYTQYETVTAAATTTTAEIRVRREYVDTVYSIPVTVSNTATNASEISTWLNANTVDLNTSVIGSTIQLDAGAGVYVFIDDDVTDTSGIELAYGVNYTHEYGFGIALYGAWDTYIHDIYIKDFHGDAIFLDKTNLRNIDGTLPASLRTCENVLIQRVTTENCRRQGISVVDCNGYEQGVALATPGGNGSRIGVVIDDCDITDTGRDIWAAPAYGIDLECYRGNNGLLYPNHVMYEYARVESVIIKNSRFTGNRKGDLNLYNSQFTQVFNNDFSYKIGHIACNNTAIHDNTFTYVNTFPENLVNSYAIALDQYISADGVTDFSHHYEIYNNTIQGGYTTGMRLGGTNHNIYSNTITDLNPVGGVGFAVGNLNNTTYHDNIINIGGSDSLAMESGVSGSTSSNIDIYNESYTATLIPDGEALQNATAIRLKNITVTGTLGAGTGILISNSVFSGSTRDVEVINCNDIEFTVNCTYTVVNQSGNTNVTIP
jgi:hypothetical protein